MLRTRAAALAPLFRHEARLLSSSTTALSAAKEESTGSRVFVQLKTTGWKAFSGIRNWAEKKWGNKDGYVLAIPFKGIIRDAPRQNQGINFDRYQKTLERSFKNSKAKAIALRINSPGGSPVQSHLIYKSVKYLKEKYNVPVVAVCGDVAASGGYFLAAAADEIIADEASIVGSIGVVSGGFGFSDLIKKWGIERRIMTAGKHKGGMDPFSPINDEEKAYTQTILNDMHEHFKNVIRSSRGDKLTASEDEVFTGRAWIGVRAKELGLVDELTDLRSYVDKKYGKIPIREVPVRPDFFSFVRRGGFSSFSEGLVEATAYKAEEKLHYERFGL
mmetsp:Transcript_20615/g.53003  ORF Transcript_20615/g.53003 Transcript_20615/m.53003 type:complete len:331 (-) Transcript_20615:853-1845(-)|eukprot:CAMPEP_0113875714 /NCGR_PEP_ID=MMETSP0780_2-20120614/5093_1 /TAXON_ID=652834 /ORGANISM="Palpitomonas bilix" /LENGTH=330 /DNA_ID=CAMNT_0000861729 /DNA_START=39 /DNA_END=1031 /DNA_ORIENTATION=- /assembly_acc=CAM_ASM_000599